MIFGEGAEERYGAPYLLAHRGDLHAALTSVVPEHVLRSIISSSRSNSVRMAVSRLISPTGRRPTPMPWSAPTAFTR